ncbi:unnamed protein product [Camellia sinensis]
MKSQWNKNIKVKNLKLQSSTQTHCSLNLHQPLQHRATLVRHRVAEPNVDQPTKKIHTSSKFECVNWACLSPRWRRARLGGGWWVSHRRDGHRREVDGGQGHRREVDGWFNNGWEGNGFFVFWRGF